MILIISWITVERIDILKRIHPDDEVFTFKNNLFVEYFADERTEKLMK